MVLKSLSIGFSVKSSRFNQMFKFLSTSFEAPINKGSKAACTHGNMTTVILSHLDHILFCKSWTFLGQLVYLTDCWWPQRETSRHKVQLLQWPFHRTTHRIALSDLFGHSENSIVLKLVGLFAFYLQQNNIIFLWHPTSGPFYVLV
jgi:hypothetical protein